MEADVEFHDHIKGSGKLSEKWFYRISFPL